MTTSIAEFRAVLGHFPTGVAVITGAEGPVGLTVQSFMALSLDPPLILLAVDRSSTSWPRIAAQRRFAVNVLSGHQQDIALGFARSGGPKFDGVDWQPGGQTAAPLIAGALAWIECEIWHTYDGGDHEIVAASVLNLRADTDPDRHPLLFCRSRFSRIST